MEDGMLSLKWNNHKRTFTKAISLYRDKELYSDVTLACDGQYFNVHKLILSSCSDYFQEIFTITQCKQPVIILKDIRPVDVEQLLQYIYMGEVDVKQSELAELIKAAECLKIKGLATPDDDTEDEIPKKKKRKRQLSGDRPDSPKKQAKSSPSNIHSDESTKNKTSQNTQLNEPTILIKTENDDVNIIEEINTKFELDKLEQKSENYDDNSGSQKYDNFEENDVPYIENEQSNENMQLTSPNTPIEYVPEYEPIAGPSGISEDSSFDNSFLDDSSANQDANQRRFEVLNYGIKRKTGNQTIYYCKLCPFNTPNKRNFEIHFRKHTGEKPFKCQYCDYCSTQKQNVHAHERKHTGEKTVCL